jgi:uncharacterized phage infection (PIP) family protein YhgE
MNRIASIFLFVLLGAGAVGIAVVPFYVLANKDRNTLASNLEMVKGRATQIEQEKQKIADEANSRVSEANAEVDRAQALIASLKEEQQLIESAKNLTKPGSKEILPWTSVVSIPQHASVLIPKTSAVESDDGDALRIMTIPTSTDPYARGELWFEILPYDSVKEGQFLAGVTSSTDAAFIVNNQLIAGKLGISADDGSPVYILTFRDMGEKKSLIFLKNIPSLGKNGAERLLSTLAFGS